MMKRILAPTDLSANSKPGLIFALQLAQKNNATLEFIYVHQFMRPVSWSDDYFDRHKMAQTKVNREALARFVERVSVDARMPLGRHAHVVEEGIRPDVTIMLHCQRHPDIDYICMSTRGAGKLDQVLGTNTGNLIAKSDIPVVAVPKNYSIRPIDHLLYASDLDNYDMELKAVLKFAHPLAAEVEVLHINFADLLAPTREMIESTFAGQFKYGLKLHFENGSPKSSLVKILKQQLNAIKPAMVIMFAKQGRSVIERLFQPGNTENLSFDLNIPLLALNKVQKAGRKYTQRSN